MRTKRLLALLFLLLCPCQGEDTVAEDLGMHQLGRLVELLTPRECEKLLFTLSHPEDSIFQQLERLSPENNDLGLSARVRRNTERKTQCTTALTEWLVNHGEQMYYDRLSRALQRIGRTDIAIEVGKNINQDKALSLQRYVDDYHRRVKTMGSPLIQSRMNPQQLATQQATKQVRDLTLSELGLLVEWGQSTAYNRRLLDGILPLVYGILLGFASAFLVGALVLYFALHFSWSDGVRLRQLSRKAQITAQRQRRHSPARFSCDLTSSESDQATPSAAPPRPRRLSSRDVRGWFSGGNLLRRFWMLVTRKPGPA